MGNTISLWLALLAAPQCDVAHAVCERELPRLAALAEEASRRGSGATQRWAQVAVEDLSWRCPHFTRFFWTPALTEPAPASLRTLDWRWLADVGSRSEALEIISVELEDASADWVWHFAWTELTTAPCPTKRCEGFRALREGRWEELLRYLETAPLIDEGEDTFVRALALEQTHRHQAALAVLDTAQPVERVLDHPLVFALRAVAARVRTGRLHQTAAAALEPGHALRAFLQVSGPRRPMPGEAFAPLF